MRKLSERYALFGLMSLSILNGLIVEAQTLVKDIKPFRASSNPEQLTSVNGILYFVADDGIHGKELWKSDGTEQGTFMVKDIIPGTGDGVIKNLVNVGGRLFFAASNPQIINKLNGGETKLWKTDGTVAGTIELKDGVNNPLESLRPTNLTNVNGTLYYTNTLALGGQSNSGLFASDGTDSPGTKQIKQFPLAAPELSHPSQLTELNGVLYFIYKGELHNSSAKIKTIITGENTDPGIQNMKKSGAKLFFAAGSKDTRRLWTSDGTAAGTIELKDGIGNPVEAPNPSSLTDVNGTLYYTSVIAKGGYSYWGLFKSDGTDYPGTQSFGTFVQPLSQNNQLESNIPYEPSAKVTGAIIPSNFINVKGTLYFVFAGYLWKSNGTAAGTRRISNTLEPGNLTHVNGVLYFVNSGNSIYATYPSSNTAYSVYKSLNTIANLIHVNGKLFYTFNSRRTTGNELYKFVLPKRKKVILPL